MTTPIETSASSKDLLDRAIKYVKTGNGLDDWTTKVAGLVLPTGNRAADERVRQIEHIIAMLQAYHDRPAPKRPLSIAVFGPPGSGKSFFVDQIAGHVTGCKPQETANLTQIERPEDLAKLFAKHPEPGDETAEKAEGTNRITPVYFFDEFDAALNGAPLGWLRWFLAPMQDATVQMGANIEGASVTKHVKRAVFIFAGGTAETMDEFNRRALLDPDAYRARKVPDFVSRLRGVVDIGGVNEDGDDRIVPRALVLQRLLKNRADLPDDERLQQLLSYGHFVHGVRSMETLLDADWGAKNGLYLPKAIESRHFSRGALDGQIVGISAGLEKDDSGAILPALTRRLLGNGATLAYGGAFAPSGTLEQVVTAVREAPPDLVSGRNQKRVRNYLGYPASLKAKNGIVTADHALIEFITLETLDREELRDLCAPTEGYFDAMPKPGHDFDDYNPHLQLAWAISLFRLRVRLLQDVSALVVLGGKDDGRSWGRVAGIAEEVMIALALGKPIYVLGQAGGAAREVGRLLGLDHAPVNPDRCLAPAARGAFDKLLTQYESSFTIPGLEDGPHTLKALRKFLFHRGATTNAWPWNGLTLEENRMLFDCPISGPKADIDEAVKLILQGLSRIEWKPVPAG
ncbi:AAA family ATPase [Chachezhania sediminis]|uniref:AAA family ATPase n=1 Tax=Chachezhania sediminis TaxID=2599291 RepID=UPI00131D5240|nr:AAA family ATPase [Chachezhania sediminis]